MNSIGLTKQILGCDWSLGLTGYNSFIKKCCVQLVATTQPYAAAAGYPAAARYAIPAAVASASPYAPAGYVCFLLKQFHCFSACYLVYIHLRNNSNLFAHFTTRVLKRFLFFT